MINPLLMILFTIHAGYSMEGGSPTNPGEFPYIASIRITNFHVCSGVIVDKKHIITVAHIIISYTIQGLRVLVGTNRMNPRYTPHHSVKEVYIHPGFEKRSFIEQGDNAYYEHDIAVLRLDQSLIWSDSVSPVPLVDRDHAWGCHFGCVLISWNIPRDGRKPMILSWESIRVMGSPIDQQWARYLGKDQHFFSDYFKATVIGVEDVGSPLVCANTLIGLVVKEEQWTIPTQPSIMMSISPYLDFINDVVHDGLFDVEPGEFPYVASIWRDGNYACGGFIVDATHVGTAGHCVMGYKMGELRVSVGYPPQWFSLVGFAIHPNYGIRLADIPHMWYIDHDFVLLTLDTPILWNEGTSPLPLVDSEDFHEGQLCKLLRWEYHGEEETGEEFMRLMFSFVIILNNQCSQPQLDPSPQSQVPSFWGKSRYLVPFADHRDVGNPIICDGNPVGFLIQAIPFDGKTTAVLARFLKIHPYMEFRNSSWFDNL